MKAVAYREYGGPEVLEPTELPDPHIGPDTMVVRVRAASLNPVDFKVRDGLLQPLLDARFPVVPGWDVAGVVETPGLDTPEFAAGDEVIAYARTDVLGGGTLAELVAVPVRTAARRPTSVGFEEAAALPLAGLTGLATVRRGGVRADSTALVHAASGGVGGFAVQLARLTGARVIGTSSPANHDYLRSLGAEPVAYGDGLVDAARALVPDGFDVILDLGAPDAMDTVPELLRDGGTVVSITDPRARDEYGGEYVWVRPDADALAELAELVDRGDLRIELAGTYDLDHAAEAFRELESGHTRGKLAIRVA